MKTVRKLLVAAAACATLAFGAAATAADEAQKEHRHEATPAGERHPHGMQRMRGMHERMNMQGRGCAFDAGQKRG